MKVAKKAVMVLCAVLIGGAPLYAQKREPSGLLLEFAGNALVPMGVAAGLGGSVGVGYGGRDFNLFFRPQVLISEPGANQRLILIPNGLFEVKLSIIPGFITLLPYVSAGTILTKLKRSDGTLGSSTALAMYAEGGIGADILLTHEISFVPRVGIAQALIYDLPDSNNYSGLTLSAAVRYSFGRSKALDF